MQDAAIPNAYLAAEGYEAHLEEELPAVEARFGRLFLAQAPKFPPAFAQNIWFAPERIPIRSIGDGAKALRARARNWCLLEGAHAGRARLLQEKLPSVSARPLQFPDPVPRAALGSWTLLERDCILASKECSSPFKHGEAQFIEDHEGPPGRAYLKLQEALTLLGRIPKKGELCLDLGSSPGSWTWVLAQLGADVLSVDKAPLDPRVSSLPTVRELRESAFALDPDEIGDIDWLFSDIICYPRRLLSLVRRWIESGRCPRFVCTIKFQGETDFVTLHEFQDIEGALVQHLFHNKHEVCFLLVPDALR